MMIWEGMRKIAYLGSVSPELCLLPLLLRMLVYNATGGAEGLRVGDDAERRAYPTLKYVVK
jgi:hypothetical protein